MVQAMEGAIDGTSDGSRSSRWYKRWITKQSMVQAMDHEAVEGDMDQEAVEAKERWMVQAMEGAIDGKSDGSRSSRRRY